MILYVLALESDLRFALIMHKNMNVIGGGEKKSSSSSAEDGFDWDFKCKFKEFCSCRKL